MALFSCVMIIVILKANIYPLIKICLLKIKFTVVIALNLYRYFILSII